jgi:uncharacterized protein YbaR (Trm112 family)
VTNQFTSNTLQVIFTFSCLVLKDNLLGGKQSNRWGWLDAYKAKLYFIKAHLNQPLETRTKQACKWCVQIVQNTDDCMVCSAAARQYPIIPIIPRIMKTRGAARLSQM